ncbi:hypothetical protein CAP36_10450 [Chitinophagaceae bacterium IBVUCB2]|nr:hypothetical protein CAP36_10450 [Chitinophagaceae bacterium IBVUCB2]
MRRKFTVLLALSFVCLRSDAQNPAEILNSWSEKSPIEKVYLHTDRENYIAGETAWFKAYLYSDYLPDTISTVLYTELINESSQIIRRSISPVLVGSSSGHLDLPDSLSTGFYVLQSYTATMLNQQPDFIFKRRVFIYGKNTSQLASKPQERKIEIDFFPEGGNLIAGLSSTVAFKAADQNGYPVAVKGFIKNEKSEIVAEFSSYHDGMGMFDLKTTASEKYYAVLSGDAIATKYELPAALAKGIVLTVMPHPQGSYFEIQQHPGDVNFEPAYMIGQIQHHVVFRQNLKAGSKELQGVINTQNLRSGIMQVTVFNKDGLPLAERLCFVNNKEYFQSAELITDTLNFSEKGKNRFSVLMKDTLKGNFSFSITDAAFNENEIRKENILTSLLLTSDIKGYVHNPAWYFANNNDSVNTAMDLVMMTNGWRRFKWNELLKAPAIKYKDPAYITLTGKVKIRGSSKPFADKQLFVWMITPDSTRTVQMVRTDKQGTFRLDSMLFYGNNRFLFSDTRGKKSDFIDVEFTSDPVEKLFALPKPDNQLFLAPGTFVFGSSKYADDYDEIRKAAGLMLDEITLKVRKKSPIQELEEKYASGMFSGMSEKTIDLINTDEVLTQENIFDYLKSRVPGLTIMDPNITDASIPEMGSLDDGTSYKIYYRYSPSASSMGPIPMTLYLNEIESSASVIATLPANQIALIKLYSSFAGAAGNGAGGVLAIYTKKDVDITMSAGSYLSKYNGFTVTKEFYAPDYTASSIDKSKTDNRITLDWRPAILINSINPKIPFTFYNNDRTKKFRLVMEGITIDGKLLMIEKIISAKAGF